MAVTIEQAQQIRLLSDGKLYCDAVDLVAKHAHSKNLKFPIERSLECCRCKRLE